MLDRKANTVYDYTRASQNVYNVTRPNQTFQEQLVSAQLLANASSDAVNRKPPIPNIGKTSSRFGYKSEPATISDVLNVNDVFPARFGDWSGSVGGYQGTSFPQIPSLY